MNRAEVLAKVLAEHREAERETERGWIMACDCGRDSGDAIDGDAWWAAHVAAVLDAALAAQEGERTVATRDGYVTEFNAQCDAEANAYKAGWADALAEIRDEVHGTQEGERESGVCVCGDDLEHHTSEHNFVDSETHRLAQEGERGGAEVAAAVEAVLADPYAEASTWTVGHIRAALADPAGALATHDAEVLRAYADSIMAEVAVWDENVYPNRWDKAREKARHARERADRIEAQP